MSASGPMHTKTRCQSRISRRGSVPGIAWLQKVHAINSPIQASLADPGNISDVFYICDCLYKCLYKLKQEAGRLISHNDIGSNPEHDCLMSMPHALQ